MASPTSKCELAIAVALAFTLQYERNYHKAKAKVNLFNELKELLDMLLRTVNWANPRQPIEGTNLKLYLHMLGLAITLTSYS